MANVVYLCMVTSRKKKKHSQYSHRDFSIHTTGALYTMLNEIQQRHLSTCSRSHRSVVTSHTTCFSEHDCTLDMNRVKTEGMRNVARHQIDERFGSFKVWNDWIKFHRQSNEWRYFFFVKPRHLGTTPLFTYTSCD